MLKKLCRHIQGNGLLHLLHKIVPIPSLQCLCAPLQILNNLLGNAAKFTHQGRITVQAQWADEQKKRVSLSVVDTGIGIPKHKLGSVFLPFEQVCKGQARSHLCICCMQNSEQAAVGKKASEALELATCYHIRQ